MYLAKALLFSFIISTSAYAQKESPSAEGAKPEEKEYSGKQSFEWTDVQKKLAENKAKLDAQDALVRSLIVERSKTEANDPAKNEQVQTEYRKLEKMNEDYNRLSTDYETKFPEKGLKENRIYKRTQVKSIIGIEKELTLEGRLKKLQNKVIRQYPGSPKHTPEPEVKMRGAKKNPVVQKPAVIENNITDKIILKK